MAAESVFYLERDGDHIVADEQNHAGYTLTIQAARQMGKSSLLGRVMARARRTGVAVAFIDFQAFGHEELVDPKRLYHQFCVLIEDALGLECQVDQHWQGPLSETQKCRRFLERRILPQLNDQGLLLALDEADALLASPSRSDFFGMLRSWHNCRQTKPEWRRFCLATAISTEPAMLIESLTQSPFNVGTTVKLEDFTLADTLKLAQRHQMQLSPTDLQALQTLLCGHPYLSRKALYLLTKRRYSFADLLGEAASETGPFGDHLRALFSRLHLRPGLIDALRNALRSGEADNEARHRLIAGGIVKEIGGRLLARNPLYDNYFRRVTKP
nr:AAA-like domain-containing protein [Roseateles oligotrophus]